MLEYRLKATLRAYVDGIFPTKLSELDNDIPYVATIPQQLTKEQQRQALENQNATNILAENFVRYDTSTNLTLKQQAQARENIKALSTYSIESDLRALEEKLQFIIDNETQNRSIADTAINQYLDPTKVLVGFTV